MGKFVKFSLQIFRFHLCASYKRIDARHDFQGCGGSPNFPHTAVEIEAESFCFLKVLLGGEDHFGSFRSQLAAWFRRTRLHKNGSALWRAGDVDLTCCREKLALEVEGTSAFWRKKGAAFCVPQEGVIAPAIPEIFYNLCELSGLTITVRMRDMARTSVVNGFLDVSRCDKVPSGTSAADLVK